MASVNDDVPSKVKTADPVTVLKDITKLVDAIKKNDDKKVNELAEMKQLRSHISDENAARAVTACQGLLSLVEDGILSPIHALSMLVAAFSNIQNFAGVTAAIGVLLRQDLKCRSNSYECPFSMLAPQHPLITLLKQRKDTWPDVFRLMQNLFFHHDENIKENSISLLKPLLFYILCDPQPHPHLPVECRRETWTLLLRLLQNMSARQLVFQTLPWFQIADDTRCVEAGMLLLDLCESALSSSDGHLCLALSPLAAASTRTLVTRGADPEPCLTVVIRLLRVSPNATSCVMLLLADAITVCPATFLASLVQSCCEILDLQSCSQMSAYAVVCALLPWLAAPSHLTREALQLASEFLTKIRTAAPGKWSNNTIRLCANAWFRLLRHSQQDVHEAAELCRIIESWRNEAEASKWLDSIRTSSPVLAARFSSLLCSLLICGPTSEPEMGKDLNWPVLSVLSWLVNERPEVSGRVALTLLYQLAQEQRATHQLALLRAIAALGKQEENMVIVLGVLKSVASAGQNSSTLAINLYVRLWKSQPRAYRFLHELLIAPMKTDNTEQQWEIHIAKAAAIKEICSINPDAHGPELVALLSEILMRCGGPEGSVASCMAVQGITALCRTRIMDVVSTWRSLAPKLMSDKRPTVILSLCELFSIVPCLPTTTGKYEDFICEVITILWGWAQHTNGEIACAALRTLSDFHLDQITLKLLPAKFRQNLTLPPSFCKTPIDAQRDPVEVLPYIPGDCWKQLLEGLGYQADRSDAVCSMITCWMRNEIKTFHRGLYNQTPGKPEPASYSHLPDGSILKTIFSLAYQSKFSAATAALALRILAADLPRPLPPVSWNFLEEKIKIEDLQTRKSCLEIAARQCKTASSAARFLHTQLAALEPQANKEDCITLFSKLLYLGQGVPPNHLGPFVSKCLKYALDHLPEEGEEDSTLLQKYLENVKIALRCPDLHENNIATISDIVEKLSDHIDISHPVFKSYIDCALVLPAKNIERITSPSLWWEVSSNKLRRSVLISSAIAVAQDSDMPLAALNDCIDACGRCDPMEQEYMLEHLINVVRACRSHGSNPDWLLQLMGRIQALKADQELQQDTKQQMLHCACDVFMVAVIVLAGRDSLAGDPKTLASSSQDRLLLFPQAVTALLNLHSSWEKLSTQVIEWLYHMSIATEVSKQIAETFSHAITPLRYYEHFLKPSVWMRIVSV